MAIRINGTLLVKKINSRNGPFCIGELVTEIGEFKVKDSLIDQFDEGKYQGKFWISQIYAHSYFAFGKVIIEIRAKLSDVQIDDEDALPSDIGKVQEVDPADEEKTVISAPVIQATTTVKPSLPMLNIKPVAKPRPRPASLASPVTTDAKEKMVVDEPTDESAPVITIGADDLALFGDDLTALLHQGMPLKLDSTIDRLQLRRQIQRLGVLGYSFTAMTQTWSRVDKQSSAS